MYGFYFGYRIGKPEAKIQNPIKAIKARKIDKEQEKEIQDKLEEINTIMENIESYDGSSKNQKELKNVETGL